MGLTAAIGGRKFRKRSIRFLPISCLVKNDCVMLKLGSLFWLVVQAGAVFNHSDSSGSFGRSDTIGAFSSETGAVGFGVSAGSVVVGAAETGGAGGGGPGIVFAGDGLGSGIGTTRVLVFWKAEVSFP